MIYFFPFLTGLIYFLGFFRLKSTQANEDGYVSFEEPVELEGALGIAKSDLRPSGVAIIDQRRVDVTTSGEYIRKGARVRVVSVKGNKVTVESLDEQNFYR